jgi:hypothetical protein
VLCRDARDGHDKLSLEARKQSLEGARRRWEGSIALTLSLQTLVTPSIPSILPSSLHVTTSTSASTALRPLPGHNTSPPPALVNEAQTEGTDPTTLVTVKIEKPSADSGIDEKHAQHFTDPNAITAIKSETETLTTTTTTTSTSTPVKSSSSCSNSSGPGCGVSTESLYPYPPIAMKLEDMPIPACRIVNPFSNGNRGAWDWLTAPYKPHVATPATDPTPSSSFSSSSSSSSSSPSSAPTSSSPPTVPAHYTQDPRTFHKQSLYNPNYENNSSSSQDPSRARCRAYADSLLQASGSSGCFDHCVKRVTGLLRMDLNAIIVDECLGKYWSKFVHACTLR